MYSPSFIDEVYKKAQEDATKLVREYQAELEKAFDVRNIISDVYPAHAPAGPSDV